MKTVSIREAKNRFTALVREAEAGEKIVVTRNGEAVADLIAHRKSGGLDLEAGAAYLRSIGVTNPMPWIADDFDDPLPEDFLIAPLPPDACKS